jgi:TctA family transporter
VEDLQQLLLGFQVALSWQNVAFMIIGVLLGIVVGVLPGLGGPNGVAILLPLTFGMDPTSAIILLSSIYWGALFGGAITSILFNIPGEAWSVATTFDGYPMAVQGRAAEALTAAFTASFIGALSGVLLITFVAPLVAKFALRFGPAEFFGVFFLTFCSFVGMGKENKGKIVASLSIGFLLAAVGLDTISGDLRMTFGQTELLKGFDFLVVVIGLFGVSEILLTIEEGLHFKGKKAKIDLKVVLKTWAGLPRYWATLIRSSVVGMWMGVTPGGAIAASFMGYGIAKRFSPRRDEFGKGEIEGVLAPETAAHAAGTSALLPMLALGIPGSATAAVLLGGLLIWGLQPGPLLFVEKKEFVWGLIASMYLGNVAGLIIVLATVPIFAAIMRIPVRARRADHPHRVRGRGLHGRELAFDIWLMLVFGLIGYVFKKLEYPLAPLVLAIVLGDRAEDAFRQALLGSGGDLRVFFSNGLVSTLMIVALLLLFWGPLSEAFGRFRGRRKLAPRLAE